MSDVSFYLPIAKVDREQRMVFGYASTPTRDLDGEVIELEAIKDALPDYMAWANVREMHQPSAVGVAKEANVDDKGLYIGAKIVDDDAWKKVTEEVYKGFSIGGDVTDRKGSTITGLDLIEISLVDRPANPDCRIDVIKAARAASEDFSMAETASDEPQDAGEVGWLRRMVEKLAGGSTAKADKEPYGDVEYADPGYQKDKKKRYPIDTEEHIRAAWNYIHQARNADKYSASQVASIKRRIVAAWKKKIDEKGPPEAKAAEPEEEKAAGEDIPAGRDGFSRPAKAAQMTVVPIGGGGGTITKGMSAAGTLSCVADALECAENCLRYEGAEEGGDPADCELADRLCDIRCDVLDVISEKALHEKREQELESEDNDELGNDLSGETKMAGADLTKRAASGRHADHVRKAAHHVSAAEREFEKLAGRRDDGDDAEKAAHIRKARADAHERGMEHLALAAHHLAKAAGERGEGPGDSERGDYDAPRGEIEDKGQREMTEGSVDDYGVERPYPGKAAKAETVSKREAELMVEAALLKGKVEAMEKQPQTPKARLFAVPRGSLPVSEAEEPTAMEKLFKGVNVEATDPGERQIAARRMIGNMIANSATFARPVLTDPTFKGGAGR